MMLLVLLCPGCGAAAVLLLAAGTGPVDLPARAALLLISRPAGGAAVIDVASRAC